MAQPRLIIVGAGPAGVRAAETLVAAGHAPVLIDEGARDGGQIYRRQPVGFRRSYSALYGSEAERAENLHATFDGLKERIDYRSRTLAWNVSEGHLHTVNEGIASALPYDGLIICAGATDRLMPVKGWDLAGVYSLGGSQIALKSQACAIGRKVVFLGSGPLLHLVAAQYVKAGADVVAVLDTSPFAATLRALPLLMTRPAVLLKGLQLTASLALARVPVIRGVTPLAIEGTPETGVSAVTVRLPTGGMRRFDCDAVGLGYHLRPETQLADLARCAFSFDAETRQFWPEVDADGRSSVRNVYLAGDGVRPQGADGAEVSGRLAALAMLADLGLNVPRSDAPALRRERARMELFRRGIATAFPWPHQLAAAIPDDAVVCRCECVTAGELRAVATEKGASEVNRAKAFSRVGMGRCQGRYCGHAAAEIVADAAGLSLEQVGRLRGQAPVKPLAIGTGSQAP
jgi:NADPH-dependent 2,4-dienoyl-CoA reductase/sulfur reductase-like enzyme